MVTRYLQIGDRVRYRRDFGGARKGDTGTVCEGETSSVTYAWVDLDGDNALAVATHRDVDLLPPPAPPPVRPRTPAPWADVFLGMCRVLGRRSKDPSSQFGAVVVGPDRQVLGCGFNGPPPAVDDARVPWGERPAKYDWINHAEENSLLIALAGHGFSGVRGATLYVNGAPCVGCVRLALRAGVSEIVYDPAGVSRVVDADMTARVARLVSTLKPGVRFTLTPWKPTEAAK